MKKPNKRTKKISCVCYKECLAVNKDTRKLVNMAINFNLSPLTDMLSLDPLFDEKVKAMKQELKNARKIKW